jgi:hypothetical protein
MSLFKSQEFSGVGDIHGHVMAMGDKILSRSRFPYAEDGVGFEVTTMKKV